MAQGWISIHRQLQSHWLWDDKPFSKGQAWVDLLLLANHADNKFMLGNELIEVKAGSFVTSERKLSERWGWSRKKVSNFLTLLQNDEMLVVKKNHQRTAITIVKYGDFQDCDAKKEPRKNHEKASKEPRKNTNNNDNNENNENKIIYSDDPALNQTIISFKSFREKIKKPMTEHAVELLIDKLNKMTPDVEKQIAIINQSIVNGWQGVFPLKEEQLQTPKTVAKRNNFNSIPQRDYDMSAIERMLLAQQNPPPTAGDSPAIQAKVEALKERLGVC